MISYQNKPSNCYLLVARVRRRGIVQFLPGKWYCGGVSLLELQTNLREDWSIIIMEKSGMVGLVTIDS